MRRVSEAILTVLSEAIDLDVRDPLTAVPARLVQDIVGLSRQFTRERQKAPLSYLQDPHLSMAYLAYFFPVNIAKVQELLDELSPALEYRPGVVRVLELGCGPGTGVIGVLDWARSTGLLKSHRLDCVALDRSQHALGACQDLWTSYTRGFAQGKGTLLTICRDVQHGLGADIRQLCGAGGYDLIIMQNVLSELFLTQQSVRIQARADLVTQALNLLSEHGTLLLIEPALRDSSRELHQLRDRLLGTTHCTLYSPCLHEGPCQALVKPTDWCHEERAWVSPGWIRAIDRKTGFIKDALKFSYALLRKDGRTIAKRANGVFRMVSELRVFKGETRAWLCNEGGRSEVGRLDRQRSDTNAAFDQGKRGTIIRIDQIVRKEKMGRIASLGRVPEGATVEIVEPDGNFYSASGSVPP
ncbi:MAG TPA: small ribosomal subunit Rsm22 family protein [Nitrospiraceae bacterium]|nr:small ribosomal subunit Rsm22 family protein [Nitrospiraceae bacterium]